MTSETTKRPGKRIHGKLARSLRIVGFCYEREVGGARPRRGVEVRDTTPVRVCDTNERCVTGVEI